VRRVGFLAFCLRILIIINKIKNKMGEIKFSSVLGPKVGRRHIGYIYSMSNYLRNSIMLGNWNLELHKR
jgi:hypothetical protein